MLKFVVFVAVLIGAGSVASNAHAGIEQCSNAPYGATNGQYETWKKGFGATFGGDDKFIQNLCKMKFGGSPELLVLIHELGFRDDDISSMPMIEVWLQVIAQIRRELRKQPCTLAVPSLRTMACS